MLLMPPNAFKHKIIEEKPKCNVYTIDGPLLMSSSARYPSGDESLFACANDHIYGEEKQKLKNKEE